MHQTLEPNEYFYDEKNEKLVIILNHEEFKKEEKRIGTQKDVDKLKRLLKKMKCNFNVFNNLEKKVILDDVPEFVKSNIFDHIDGLIVFILTHGDGQNSLQAASGGYNLFDFINKFHPNTFKILENKPKLFFISACRGHEFQTTHSVNASTGVGNTCYDATAFKPTPRTLYGNLLIAFGTYASTYGIRHEFTGTRFINALCEIFDEFIRNTPEEMDILKLLLKANNKLCKNCEGRQSQLAQVYSSFSKPYYFRKSLNV